MPVADILTRASIWAAILWWAASYWPGRWQTCRLLWTLACAAFEAHALGAFAGFYHWSHATALTDTARQSAAVTGLAWSGGIYVNYAMAGLWLGDTVWWWTAPASRARRPCWLAIAWHGFAFFMVVNGAVVFNPRPSRWLGALVVVAAALLAVRRFTRSLSLDAAGVRV